MKNHETFSVEWKFDLFKKETEGYSQKYNSLLKEKDALWVQVNELTMNL